MDFKTKIVHWNCRGLKPNYNEILLLLSLLKPSVFCLQETFLKQEDNINFKGFNLYNYIYTAGQKPSGGSFILVHSSYPQREIKLSTDLQAVAVSVSLEKEITICSLYIPLNFTLHSQHLNSLLEQLPSPYLLVGDFNGHNMLWGCSKNNIRGEIIENFIEANDLCLMNDKSHTYLHPATGTFSSLDLSLCHPSLILDFDWYVCDDQHGSDHFPVVIESINPSTEDHNPKWKLNKANWEQFHLLCEQDLSMDNFNNSSDLVTDFTSSLMKISDKCIPKTSSNPKKSNPWYNNDCKNAVRQRKQALSKFCKYPTGANLKNVKIQRAKARRTIKSAKRNTWKSYVSKLNHKTPIKKVWDMIRKISGKSKAPSYTHLNTCRETKATSKEDIANTLGETFLKNSSSQNYSEKFKHIKMQQEKNNINFKSLNNEEYNNPFNLLELIDAIQKSNDTATGPDEVHYQMLKHLPNNALSTLLHIYNDIWATGVFPESWRLATIIPIPKPGKDHEEPSNYRPIALTWKPTAIRPFGLRVLPLLDSTNINPNNIEKHFVTEIPSWCMKKPDILFDLHTSKKSASDSLIMKQNFHILQSHYTEYQHIYTDGSKDGEKVGCAFLYGNHFSSLRIPDGSSVFTAEAKAIDLALDFIDSCFLHDKFLIFSDSLSVLKALNHTSSKNSQIQKLLEKHHKIANTKEILFCWLPSYVGIIGNEIADRKAKDSLHLNMSTFEIPFNSFKPLINKYILSEWQKSWDTATFNKLHAIKPVVGNNSSAIRNIRREDVVITRRRIGHTRFTHSYILNREEQPFCIACNQHITVKHILTDCIDFLQDRNKYFQVRDLRQLFQDVPVDNILSFLKDTNLFNKI